MVSLIDGSGFGDDDYMAQDYYGAVGYAVQRVPETPAVRHDLACQQTPQTADCRLNFSCMWM